MSKHDGIVLADDPLWYKDAVIYELHVRAFADSDGDGVGDFRGLTERLDYLQDLGVTALWILPFYPSPLRDDGYDIADYRKVNPAYGTIADFRRFLREAHKRGLRVITELVINHTSDQHPWFQRARRAKPGSIHRDFYVWSDTPDKYADARIIFQDFETSNWTWDPVARQYFWHRFYSHQPDLNFENPHVRKAIFSVMDHWFEMGVDGMRLDAVPYLFEREGTNCENLDETHQVLKELRSRLDEKHSSRMLLAEANQWPEDASAYFGDGDECHMNFHFPLMPRLFMAVRMEDRYPIIDILDQTPEIPENAQWALFLRNHDELTLEMVTDEERDYMYRVYAGDRQSRINLGIRRRLAPLLGNNRRKIELLNGLLLSLPGTPVLYYGDEIGMGDNIYLGDRDSVRTPMQWSADRNGGFSRANPQKLFLPVIIDPEYHHEAINVESQRGNPHSLFWWMKRAIALRQRHQVFGRGDIEFLLPDNHRVLVYTRSYEDDTVLVVANLSRFVQCVELDLSGHAGVTPVELFGQNPFPAIGELPYFLTLGPHSFYWFSLKKSRERIAIDAAAGELPTLNATKDWDELLRGKTKARLERILPAALENKRWFGGKARTVQDVSIQEETPISTDAGEVRLIVFEVHYTDGEPESYQLPLTLAAGNDEERVLRDHPAAAIARVSLRSGEGGVLYDASVEPAFGKSLLSIIDKRRKLRGHAGEIVGVRGKAFRSIAGGAISSIDAAPSRAEQSNTSILFGDRFIMKLYRRVAPGVNPDLEIGRFLTEERGFQNTARIAGSIDFEAPKTEPKTLAVLQEFIPNEGDGWRHALDALGQFFERVQTSVTDGEGIVVEPPEASAFDLLADDCPENVAELIGPYMASVELLGRRTAEMHVALAKPAESAAFRPEPFSQLYRRSLYQSMRNMTGRAIRTLRKRLASLDEPTETIACALIDGQKDVLARFREILSHGADALRTRIHGDYHLGQVLFTGRDFIIIDFEGEPARSLTERRLKRSPLRDVAGMLRSFDYAAHTAMFTQFQRWAAEPGGREYERIERGARLWRAWTQKVFLASYLDIARNGDFLPEDDEGLRTLIDLFVLDKAMYELLYELNNRPTWVGIPLRGIVETVERAIEV